MENVTLTPKEQMRVQVLNSLLAEQIALDCRVDGCQHTPRPPSRPPTGRKEQPPWHTATGAANRDIRGGDRRRGAPGSTRYQGANHTHLSELLAEREGIDMNHPTTDPCWMSINRCWGPDGDCCQPNTGYHWGTTAHRLHDSLPLD